MNIEMNTKIYETPNANGKFYDNNYVEALEKFIDEYDASEAPITISLQGEWGTGKTSILNKIKSACPESLNDEKNINNNENYIMNNIETFVELNVWRYMQFHLDKELSIVLLIDLYSQLVKKTHRINREDILSKIAKFKNIIIPLVNFGISLSPLKILEDNSYFKESKKGLFDLLSDKKDDIDYFAEIKKEFNEQIEILCENYVDNKNNNKKVLIIIDDLDRITPTKAVEVLEALKLFVDCAKCVFLIAVDNDVIKKGAVDKYGLSEKKSKDFFDKMIQLPFEMPVESANVREYIKEYVDKIFGKDYLNNSDDSRVLEIIEKVVGHNPRQIKRLFTSFNVILYVASKKPEYKNNEKKLDNSIKECLLFVLALKLMHNDLSKNIFNIVSNTELSYLQDCIDADENNSENFISDEIFNSIKDNEEIIRLLINIINKLKNNYNLNNKFDQNEIDNKIREIILMSNSSETSVSENDNNFIEKCKNTFKEYLFPKNAPNTDLKQSSRKDKGIYTIYYPDTNSYNYPISISFEFKQADENSIIMNTYVYSNCRCGGNRNTQYDKLDDDRQKDLDRINRLSNKYKDKHPSSNYEKHTTSIKNIDGGKFNLQRDNKDICKKMDGLIEEFKQLIKE